MNKSEIIQAYREWENFIAGLTEAEKVELSMLEEPVSSNNLFYYAVTKDTQKFDLAISRLSKRYLYDEEIAPTIYNFYLERDLHEAAYNYLIKSQEYHRNERGIVPIEISAIFEHSETTHLLNKLKLSLINIRSISAQNICKITPDIINDKRNPNKFILNEIVQASRVLLDKIHAIKQISHEDRFNDLLLAILRLRFPIWGWTIMDQARIGNSATGINAGEIDVLVQAGGNNIAFIEALILTGANKTLTETHLIKCFNYISYLKRYYILIYFRGNQGAFDTTWNSYKEDTLATRFPSGALIDSTKDFEDLSAEFNDVRNLKIAKTIHNTDIEMFHVMINLGL